MRHMKYWIDTEFIERPCTIDLISIALVAEDGREFYAESSEVDWTKASQWTLQTVRPQLHGTGMEREEIGYAVRRFIEGDEHLVFWGYFPAYDWVAFCWLFGDMNELPFRFPQLCLDIKQWAIELGNPDLPLQSSARHHALNDARWTREAWAFLASLNPAVGERRSIGCRNPDQLAAKSS
jgi:3'-5' exoribonuclease-like protein